MKKIPIFLELEDILEIHSDLIDICGGSHGIRDQGLLFSAIEIPKSGIGNEFFHIDIFEMAAAYLFHIAKNHPFIDGNKRIALACADTFLEINGYTLLVENNELYDLVINVSSKNVINKNDIALFFKKYTKNNIK